jgi:hypothetical protein
MLLPYQFFLQQYIIYYLLLHYVHLMRYPLVLRRGLVEGDHSVNSKIVDIL